jgi:hypothetical protein
MTWSNAPWQWHSRKAGPGRRSPRFWECPSKPRIAGFLSCNPRGAVKARNVCLLQSKPDSRTPRPSPFSARKQSRALVPKAESSPARNTSFSQHSSCQTTPPAMLSEAWASTLTPSAKPSLPSSQTHSLPLVLSSHPRSRSVPLHLSRLRRRRICTRQNLQARPSCSESPRVATRDPRDASWVLMCCLQALRRSTRSRAGRSQVWVFLNNSWPTQPIKPSPAHDTPRAKPELSPRESRQTPGRNLSAQPFGDLNARQPPGGGASLNAAMAAYVFPFLLGSASVFQLALVAGKPWGRLTWGGRFPVTCRSICGSPALSRHFSFLASELSSAPARE